MFMCVSCFGLVVSTCQVIGYRKTPLMTPSWGEKIISTKPRWKRVFMCIFLLFGLFMLLCFPPALRNIYFICLWHDIAYMCWKCRYTPSKQTNELHLFPNCTSFWDMPKLSMSFLTQFHQDFFVHPVCLIISTSHFTTFDPVIIIFSFNVSKPSQITLFWSSNWIL